jgi:hypothetical protein
MQTVLFSGSLFPARRAKIVQAALSVALVLGQGKSFQAGSLVFDAKILTMNAESESMRAEFWPRHGRRDIVPDINVRFREIEVLASLFLCPI